MGNLCTRDCFYSSFVWEKDIIYASTSLLFANYSPIQLPEQTTYKVEYLFVDYKQFMLGVDGVHLLVTCFLSDDVISWNWDIKRETMTNI